MWSNIIRHVEKYTLVEKTALFRAVFSTSVLPTKYNKLCLLGIWSKLRISKSYK